MLRPFQNIAIGIGYCYSLNKILVMVLGISWNIGFHYPSGFLEIRGTKRQKYWGIGIGIGWYWGVLELLVLLLGIVKGL